jgi:hypothetical protein
MCQLIGVALFSVFAVVTYVFGPSDEYVDAAPS